jgi:hypothetical protein
MKFGRVVAVTLSIALVGAVIGGVVGLIVFFVWRFPLLANTRTLPVAGAAYGAMLGSVLAPITAWTFLRRVPIGKALMHATIGTTIGTVLGLILDRTGGGSIAFFPAGLAGALLGFLAAAIRLRFATRTTAAEAGMESTRPGSGS